MDTDIHMVILEDELTKRTRERDTLVELCKLMLPKIYHDDDCSLRYNLDYCDCGYYEIEKRAKAILAEMDE